MADRAHLDPTGILHQAFEMGTDFPGPAEDILMSWLISLGPDTGAGAAATELAPAFKRHIDGPAPNPHLARLHGFLIEISTTGAAKPTRGQVSRRRQETLRARGQQS